MLPTMPYWSIYLNTSSANTDFTSKSILHCNDFIQKKEQSNNFTEWQK